MKLPAIAMDRLKNRSDFLRAARGVRRVAAGVTLEVCVTPSSWAKPQGLRVGFTASKKIGMAVERNRARRRLKAAAAQMLPLYGLPGNDYVLVARRETLIRPFDGLLADLASVLHAAHQKLGRSKAGDSL
ncbi:MAG TPA: ribonuclease P protein component [Rhizomicrobium sp.]